MSAVYVALGALALLGLWVAMAYKGLVEARNRVDEAWSAVVAKLARRHDLVPDLVETVEGYAPSERTTLQTVTAARAAAVLAKDPEAVERAESRLTSALRKVNGLAEANPELGGARSFQSLQGELTGIDGEIHAARRTYNAKVRHYNRRTRRFPTLLVATLLSFGPCHLFEVGRPAEADQHRRRAA